VLSVEDSYYLTDDGTPLTATFVRQGDVDLDLRSASSWHLNASSVAVITTNATSGDINVQLRLFVARIQGDGSEGQVIDLSSSNTSFTSSETQTVTLARSVHLGSGLYRIVLEAAQNTAEGVTIATLQGGATPQTVISAQATREALYL
jgi:hypothetical protein